jgi:hypothetical protein
MVVASNRYVRPYTCRLIMELDLQSLFGLHVYSCTHWLSTRNSPSPRIWAYIHGQLVVSQDNLQAKKWIKTIEKDISSSG